MIHPNSIEAHKSVQPHVSTIEETVMNAIRASENGLTRDGISEQTGLRIQTVCPTVFTLRDTGKLVEAGDTRPTRSGRQGAILRAA